MTRPPRLLGSLLLSSLLVACGAEPSEGDDGVSTSDLTETTTHEALAAAVLADLDVEPISIAATELDDDAPADAVAVELRLPLSDDDFGLRLLVAVTTEEIPDAACGQDENEDGCTDDDLPDGSRQLVTWEAEEPEEDPGILNLLTERTDPEASVAVFVAGPTIPEELTDDTELELFTLGDLKDLSQNPEIGPTTTPEAIAAGEDLPDEWWVEPGSDY